MKSPIDFRADQGQHMDRDQTYVEQKELEQQIQDWYGVTPHDCWHLFDTYTVDELKKASSSYEDILDLLVK